MYNIVFVGLPNVGKTTYVNYLSGSHFRVANYLGVSVGVEKKIFIYKKHKLCFVDLPGIYDLDIASGEERFTKKYLEEENIDLIVNVMDPSDLHRGIHLCAQLKKLKIPMLVLLNEKGNKNYPIDVDAFSFSLHTPVVEGVFKEKEKLLNALLKSMQDVDLATFDERNISISYIDKKHYALDTLFLHPIWGIFFLSIVLFFLFYMVFVCGDVLSSFLISLLYQFSNMLTSRMIGSTFIIVLLYILLSAFVAISSFMPYLLLIYIVMAILEESGFMARIAYLLDPFMRLFHLSGKSVIPFIIGFGCSVPAIFALRTLDDKREKAIMARIIPFISCSGKMPIFLLFTSIFFASSRGFMLFLLYTISIVIALVFTFLFTKKEEELFIMELPSYAFPRIKNIYKKVSREMVLFYKKSLKVIVLGTLFLLFLLPYIKMDIFQFLLTPLGFAENMDVVESLPFGLLSKENLLIFFSNKANSLPLSTYIESLWPLEKQKLMAFCYLFYLSMSMPCVMTLSAIKSEFGSKFLWISILVMLFVPYLFCFLLFNTISLLHFLF